MAAFASFFEKYFSKNSSKPTTPSAIKSASPEPSSREDRNQLKEKFYHIVRDCMVRAGVLTGGYKFKVLSHERADAGMMVMVDLAPSYMAQSAQLREIEQHMARMAEVFLGILAVRVYWRVNEGLDVLIQPQQALTGVKASAPAIPEPFHPVSAEEIAAFRRAHLETSAHAPTPAPRSMPLELGATQFGELV